MDAVGARMPVAEEGRRGAGQAVVVEGLDHGDSEPRGRTVDGRGRGGERVVHVDDVRPIGSNGIRHSACCPRRPDRGCGEPKVCTERAGLAEIRVVEDHLAHIEAGFLEKDTLSLNGAILAAGLSISGVHLEDSANALLPAHRLVSRGAKRMTTRPRPKMLQNQMPPWGPSR